MIIKPNLQLLNNCRQQFGLQTIPSLPALNQNAQAIYEETRIAAINYIIEHDGQLPVIPFPELHAYRDVYPIQENFSIFLIGTFPPISYLIDLLEEDVAQLAGTNGRTIRKPKIPFYHGQRCSQWKLFGQGLIPQIINEANRLEIKDAVIHFLCQNSINYFDVMNWCQRLQYNAADNNLVNILPNTEALAFLLTQNLDNPLLVFNTSSAFGINGLQFNANGTFKPAAKSFDLFLSIGIQLGFNISFSIDNIEWIDMVPANSGLISNLMRRKLIFYLKLNDKVYTVVAGVSPSTATLNLGANPCYQAYLNQGHQPGHPAFKRFVYQNAIAKNFEALWPLNV